MISLRLTKYIFLQGAANGTPVRYSQPLTSRLHPLYPAPTPVRHYHDMSPPHAGDHLTPHGASTPARSFNAHTPQLAAYPPYPLQPPAGSWYSHHPPYALSPSLHPQTPYSSAFSVPLSSAASTSSSSRIPYSAYPNPAHVPLPIPYPAYPYHGYPSTPAGPSHLGTSQTRQNEESDLTKRVQPRSADDNLISYISYIYIYIY